MQKMLVQVVTLAWALWLGGLIVLFIAVQSLFATFSNDRTLAGAAASGIFRRFNRYQLALALVALLGSLAWKALSRRGGVKVLVSGFALATLTAVAVGAVITPKIEAMRLLRNTHSAQFARLHGVSMLLYLIEAVLLIITGMQLPAENRSGPRDGAR